MTGCIHLCSTAVFNNFLKESYIFKCHTKIINMITKPNIHPKRITYLLSHNNINMLITNYNYISIDFLSLVLANSPANKTFLIIN